MIDESNSPIPPADTESDIAAAPEVETPAATPLTTPTPPTPPSPPSKPAWRMLVAPAWFLLGILVGLVAFAGYAQVTKPPVVAAPTPIDAATIKQAARDGLMEAIQALQAQSGQSSGSGASQEPPAVDKNAITARPANRLGDAKAPVTIVEFADFQCPFCGRHHQTVEPTLIQQYVNTGKVSLVYKHLPFLGQESAFAAVAAECAADQGKFWQYHDYLFEHQNGENQGAFTKDKLIGFGQTMGLDMTKFQPCVQNDATLARVQDDVTEAQKLGVSSTPTFFVNGQPVVGLTSLEEFQQIIDKASSQ